MEVSLDLISDIELERASLSAAALKASRLARLLNDFDSQEMFKYEAGGYPTAAGILPAPIWRLAVMAGRATENKDLKTGEITATAFIESVDTLIEQISVAKLGLGAAGDPDVSITSANQYQYVQAPMGNKWERQSLQTQINSASGKLASRRALIFDYAIRSHYGLKYSGIAQDVFTRVRAKVDKQIGEIVPGAAQKFAAVYDNLRSENPEDWSNAVHSCRRILQDLADVVFPATDVPRVVGKKEIQLGPDNYINRLVCYCEDQSTSSRTQAIIGSHLGFMGDRLDAVFGATQKGSHGSVSKDEADRYVLYTYMLVGDILSLE